MHCLHTYYVQAGTTPVLVHNDSCSIAKGNAGEDRAVQELTDRGYTIMGRHVKAEAGDGTTSYIDIVATREGEEFGAPTFFEVKNGSKAKMSVQQRTVYGEMGKGSVTLRTDQMASWGLREGDQIGGDVRFMFYGGAKPW